MARMKKNFMYLFSILLFLFCSYLVENGLIENMYIKMAGIVEPSSYQVEISDVKGKASNVNGFMEFTVSNKGSSKANQYLKIDLYSELGNLASTKYIEITDLDAGEKKEYKIKFSGSEIINYRLSVISKDQVPDMSNIISILGWEIDLSNVFGIDMSNAKLFGVKLTEMFSVNNIKSTGSSAWSWTAGLLSSIPWWGYAIGAGIVFWYMPKGYLFGVFPF